MGAATIAGISRQTEKDIPIREHKIYRREAALCAADGPPITLRRWARQFYL